MAVFGCWFNGAVQPLPMRSLYQSDHHFSIVFPPSDSRTTRTVEDDAIADSPRPSRSGGEK